MANAIDSLVGLQCADAKYVVKRAFEDTDSLGEFTSKRAAVKLCKASAGYNVFDANGVIVFSNTGVDDNEPIADGGVCDVCADAVVGSDVSGVSGEADCGSADCVDVEAAEETETDTSAEPKTEGVEETATAVDDAVVTTIEEAADCGTERKPYVVAIDSLYIRIAPGDTPLMVLLEGTEVNIGGTEVVNGEEWGDAELSVNGELVSGYVMMKFLRIG